MVESNPGGAEISLDGTSTGKYTPAALEVSAGIHQIALEMEGYKSEKRGLQITGGGKLTLHRDLIQLDHRE